MHPALAIRLLLLTVSVLLAIIVGMVAGILARLGRKGLPNSITVGGGAFCAALSLMILIFNSLGVL